MMRSLIFFHFIIVTVLSFFTLAPATHAEVDIHSICHEKILPELNKEFSSFKTWIEQHLQNEASNRQLLADAVLRFKQFERRIMVFLRENFVVPEGTEAVTAANELNKCTEIVSNAVLQARDILKYTVLSKNEVKREIGIVRKLRHLNARFKKLNQDMGYFRGYLNTLNSKVPCYIGQCVR